MFTCQTNPPTGFWDTRLDTRGVAQAEALNHQLLKEAANWATNKDAQIDLIVSSPLSRALHTASLAFEGEPLRQVPRAVHAGLRERMWLSSDVGTSPDELSAAWSGKDWDFSELENRWWYTDDSWQRGDDDWRKKGDYLHPGEPEQPFVQVSSLSLARALTISLSLMLCICISLKMTQSDYACSLYACS